MSDLEESFRENTFDPEAVIAAMQPPVGTPPPSAVAAESATFGAVNGFEETGNQIAVNPDQMIAEVKERLRQFDHAGDRSLPNPYRETVVISLDDGRQVAVPSTLQTEAIREWESEKEILYRRRLSSRSESGAQEPIVETAGDTESSRLLWIVIAVALAWFFLRSRNSD